MCKHFFLIDDDEDELEIFMAALSKLHVPCKCTFAQNAAQALDILNYLKPDVVFIDINMPQVNGFECARQIRAKEGHENTNIVLYSNGANDISLREARECGATSCIKKTNSISALVTAMHSLIESPDQVSRIDHKSAY